MKDFFLILWAVASIAALSVQAPTIFAESSPAQERGWSVQSSSPRVQSGSVNSGEPQRVPRDVEEPAALERTSVQLPDALAVEKRRLEIEKLRTEIKTSRWSPIISAGTLIAALAAAAISLFTALRAQRLQIESLGHQAEQARQDRVSRLLEQLGHREPAVRAGIVQALGRYPDCLPFVATLLEVETNPTVVAAIRVTLQQGPASGLEALLDVTRRVRERCKRLARRMRVRGLRANDIARCLHVPQPVLRAWLENVPQPEHSAALKDIPDTELAEWMEENAMLTVAIGRIVLVAGALIRHRAGLGDHLIILDSYLPGIDLSGTNLVGSRFDRSELWHANLDAVIARSASFREACLANAGFRSAAMHDTDLSGSIVDGASFRVARLARTNFSRCHGQDARFEGAKISGATFSQSEIQGARFSGAKGRHVTFKQAVLHRAYFTSAILPDADMSGADLRGADLGKSQLRRANFTNAKFGGNNFGKTDFTGASFRSATLRGIHCSDSAKLVGVTIDGAIFGEGSEQMQAAVLGAGAVASQLESRRS